MAPVLKIESVNNFFSDEAPETDVLVFKKFQPFFSAAEMSELCS